MMKAWLGIPHGVWLGLAVSIVFYAVSWIRDDREAFRHLRSHLRIIAYCCLSGVIVGALGGDWTGKGSVKEAMYEANAIATMISFIAAAGILLLFATGGPRKSDK